PYYRKIDREKNLEYYRSLPEYKYEYAFFGGEGELKYVDIKCNKEVFYELQDEDKTGKKEESIINKKTEEYVIVQKSTDNVFCRQVFIFFIDNNAYVGSTSYTSENGEEIHTGYQIDDQTAQYIKSLLSKK
ncbi:MAG: hypothetical protein PHH84_09355, partial [Oscillospiraceae bacterium]|nr:hypothetical protein [Oscillospiraceae bacterium]